jgi:hypothetical protein
MWLLRFTAMKQSLALASRVRLRMSATGAV